MENYGEGAKWWTEKTVAVVTGSNRGIGLETVRLLAEKGLTVVLTARNHEAGLALLNELGYPNVHFHQLDVQSEESVHELRDWLHNKFNGLDILINNAAVTGSYIDTEFLARHGIKLRTLIMNPLLTEGIIEDYERAKACIETNYFGTKRMVKTLFPLLKPSPSGSRIVNVSSAAGLLKVLGNEALKTQVSDVENLKEEMIDDFVNNYLNDFQLGQTGGKGWPTRFGAYSISKIAVNAYTRLLARDFGRHPEHGHEVYINCIHPGFVKTDMTHHEGDLDPDESATFLAGLALYPPGGPSGQYFNKRDIGSF